MPVNSRGEHITGLAGGELLDGGLEGLEAAVGAVDAVEPRRQDRRHAGLELACQLVGVDGSLAAGVRVGCLEGGGDLGAQTDVVDDEPVALVLPGPGVGEAAVGAGDGLEQGVPTQRLVQVHDLLDGGVEPGEQLRRHHQERQRVVLVVEPLLDPGLLVPGERVRHVLLRLVRAGPHQHDDLRALMVPEPMDTDRGPAAGEDR